MLLWPPNLPLLDCRVIAHYPAVNELEEVNEIGAVGIGVNLGYPLLSHQMSGRLRNSGAGNGDAAYYLVHNTREYFPAAGANQGGIATGVGVYSVVPIVGGLYPFVVKGNGDTTGGGL